MPATVRIFLNQRNVGKILRGEASNAEAVVTDEAKKIAARTGNSGFSVDHEIGPHRARAAVIARTIDARHDEATNRTLTKAIK